VDLVTLSDGDVLRMGDSVLQVAISCEQTPDESAAGIFFSDPLALPQPLELRRDDGTSWRAETAVTVLGRSPGAEIRLDHPDVSLVHAAVFAVGGELAVADLDSRTGLTVNGEKRTFAVVKPGDKLGLGPFAVALGGPLGAYVEGRPTTEPPGVADAAPSEALERLREELTHRASELEQNAAQLEREQRAIESARQSLELERGALLRQAAALRELEMALDSRRRSLEHREKALRESLLRQAHGVLSAAGTFGVPAAVVSEPGLLAAARN
jgi:pSer/pThr/pTyr-binding forkhead associated (FHA) protein